MSFPAGMLKPPTEGNRSVPISVLWLRDGDPPGYTVEFNAESQRVVPISQISALYIDNSHNSATVNIVFPDTGFSVIIPESAAGYFPVVTNGLRFYMWVSTTPTAQDMTIVQVLNFLPPAVVIQSTPFATGPVGQGTVREVDTGPGLSGGPITDTGTVSLVVPVAIANGGTGARTPQVAIVNLGGLPIAGGAMTGALTLAADPTAPLQAATKEYVDSHVPAGGPFVPTAGGAIIGAAPGNLAIGSTVALPPGGLPAGALDAHLIYQEGSPVIGAGWFVAGWLAGVNPAGGVIYRCPTQGPARTITELTGVLSISNGGAASVTVNRVPAGASSGSAIHSGVFDANAAAMTADQTLPLTTTALNPGDRLVIASSGIFQNAAASLFARII